MQIRLDDLEPTFRRRLLDNPRFATLRAAATHRPNDPPVRVFWRLLGAVGLTCLGWFLSLLVIGLLGNANVSSSVGVPVMIALFLGVPALASAWFQRRPAALFDRRRAKVPQPQRNADVTSESLQSAFALLEPTETERAYWDALQAVRALDARLDDARERMILKQLNDLLESSYRLEQQQQNLAATLGPQTQLQQETKAEELKRQLRETRDPETRKTVEQALSLCEARLSSLQDLNTARDRLSAQQEVVCQTLFSLQAALTRMRITPEEADTNVTSVQETVAQINRESRSVEQAIQEVAALRR